MAWSYRRRLLKRREGERASLVEPRASAVANRGDQAVVLVRAGHDGDVRMVLGGRSDERRAADVDVLDRIGEGRAGTRHRGLERIEVDDHQIDGREPEALERGEVVGDVAASEDSRVNLGVQRLDPASEHLGLAGVVGDLCHRKSRATKCGVCAATRQERRAAVGKGPRQLDQTALVVDAQDRSPNRHDAVAHGSVSWC